MNIKQIVSILTEGGIEPGEAKIEAKMLVKHFLNISDIDLALGEEFEYSELMVEKAKLRVKTKQPIQNIIGYAHFMGEEFIVNQNVLIPRDETEILVRKAIETIRGQEDKKARGQENSSSFDPLTLSSQKVLDIGTGSGCIACMIAKLTEAQVLGVDISIDALQVALDNSSKLGLFNRAIFRKSNLFSNIRKEGLGFERFDLIVSNPPYIPLSQKGNLQSEVEFEPESALFAPDIDGIEFYEKIAAQATEYLNDGGYLMFELGIGQADKVKSLMEKSGFKNIEIIKDLAYIERVIIGEK